MAEKKPLGCTIWLASWIITIWAATRLFGMCSSESKSSDVPPEPRAVLAQPEPIDQPPSTAPIEPAKPKAKPTRAKPKPRPEPDPPPFVMPARPWGNGGAH